MRVLCFTILSTITGGLKMSFFTSEKLRAIRSIKGISQAELAKRSGVAVSVIANFEIGRRGLNMASFEKMLKAMDVTIVLKVSEGVTFES